MFAESDQVEGSQSGEPNEQVQLDANDTARRRVLEYNESRLDCEHPLNSVAEDAALDRSARIMDQWEKTEDPEVRRRLLDGVGREMMKVHEAPPAELHPQVMAENELGAYSDEDFRTDINQEQLKEDDPKNALETYLHEYRHVEQNYEVQKSHGALAHEAEAERALALEYNLRGEHYIDGHKDQDAYTRQLVEADAERFGTTTAREILERRQEFHQDDSGWAAPTNDADRMARARLIAERRPPS